MKKIKENNIMDEMVKRTQVYLNAMYGGNSGYEVIPENGITGWTTIYALTRALQIELGITATADSFGPTTISKFNSKFPNGIKQQNSSDTTENNIYAIIQGALWCKGYSTGATGITKHFYSGTGGAVKKMKEDAGLTNTDSTVTLAVMKALLSMNQYVTLTLRGGNEKIRQIQQHFNNKYIDYIGLAPCDGVYGREMNQAMIKVLQAIEKFSVSEATGYFGEGTKNRLPMLPSKTNEEAIYLFRAALCCNGYDVLLSTTWDTALENKIDEFQKDMLLTRTKKADTNTWMALLVSRGNTDRSSNGCDTRFEMTQDRLNILKANGYEVIGRYLTGGSFKELREGEVERIISNGMKLFPIFQESGANLEYFTSARGKIDAEKSTKAARKYGIPKDSIIYFAVDTDPLDGDITGKILPYFKSLSENFDPEYKIGVYGTRNVCTQVCNKGFAETSFVSDMSYGFSGNMGFKIPQKWNLDQYYEIKVSESGWDFDLDKTMYSGRFPLVSKVEHSSYERPEIPTVKEPSINTLIDDIKNLESMYVTYYEKNVGSTTNPSIVTPNVVVNGITNFLRGEEYEGWQWFFTTGHAVDEAFSNYVKKNNAELYSRLKPYIRKETSKEKRFLLSDGNIGLIDLSHMAATIEAYLGTGLPPSFWAGWGGDLATGMSDTTINYENKNKDGFEIYKDKDLQTIANMTIGKNTLTCNYSDFCCDFDAYAIQKKIRSYTDETDYHRFSKALSWYYTAEYAKRFEQIFDEIGCSKTLGGLKAAVYDKMTGVDEKVGLLLLKADNPSDEVIQVCCSSFANYVYSMI